MMHLLSFTSDVWKTGIRLRNTNVTVWASSPVLCSCPPSHVGNGWSHSPFFPQISMELPFRYFPGASQLNLRKRSGRTACSFSGIPLMTTSPSAGGRSHLNAGKRQEWAKGWDFYWQTTCLKTSAAIERLTFAHWHVIGPFVQQTGSGINSARHIIPAKKSRLKQNNWCLLACDWTLLVWLLLFLTPVDYCGLTLCYKSIWSSFQKQTLPRW